MLGECKLRGANFTVNINYKSNVTFTDYMKLPKHLKTKTQHYTCNIWFEKGLGINGSPHSSVLQSQRQEKGTDTIKNTMVYT